MKINKVGVLGNGVMGTQIAAVFANANIPTLLFGYEENMKSSLDKLKYSKPPALTHRRKLDWITPKDLESDLEELRTCDLIIEVIIEDLDAKRIMFEKIIPYLKASVVLATNTSSLSVNDIAKDLGIFKDRFCGIHFFNPPRYMPLVEIIPANWTDVEILDEMERFLTSEIGKNIIYAEDNPGFIANRIGVFSLASCIHHATRFSINFDTVDAMTGTKIKRPKSATFRTADLVGLDTLKYIFEGFYETLTEDPWRHYFKPPKWLDNLVEQKLLGEKSKSGIYKKVEGEIKVYKPKTNSYEKANYNLDESVKDILKQDMSKWIRLLKDNSHPHSQFLYYVIKDTCLYSAYHLPDIAQSCRDIDWALHWGFGWDVGIFELWQVNGIQDSFGLFLSENEMNLDTLWPHNVGEFYKEEGAYSPQSRSYVPYSSNGVYAHQLYRPCLLGEKSRNPTHIIFENESAIFFHDGDGIAVFSSKTKLHTLNLQLINSLKGAILIAEEEYSALVLWQSSPPFSAGANLYEIVATAKLGMIEHQNLFTRVKQKAWHLLKPNLPDVEHLIPINEVIELLQETLMNLKYSRIPTIAAIEGLAIGGGCELLLHCDRRVAHTESYIGLVEMGVGLLPAGGGCKEMVIRASRQGNIFPTLSKYFEQIGLAQVSESANLALDMGYLDAQDIIVPQRLDLLYFAKEQAKQLIDQSYRPELRHQSIRVAGTTGKANILAKLTNMKIGGFISEYDYYIAEKIADVMCGGELLENSEVDSDYLLKLERIHFIELLKEDKTQDRIEHMLIKHKPLRN